MSLPYPIPGLPAWQLEAMVVLVEALGDPPLTRAELASLAIVARQGRMTVDNLAALIRRAVADTASEQLRRLADEHEPDLQDPDASAGVRDYRLGVARLCAALRQRAGELDGGRS